MQAFASDCYSYWSFVLAATVALPDYWPDSNALDVDCSGALSPLHWRLNLTAAVQNTIAPHSFGMLSVWYLRRG